MIAECAVDACLGWGWMWGERCIKSFLIPLHDKQQYLCMYSEFVKHSPLFAQRAHILLVSLQAAENDESMLVKLEK